MVPCWELNRTRTQKGKRTPEQTIRETQYLEQTQAKPQKPERVANSRGRPRDRQPGRQKGSSTHSSRTTATSREPTTQSRRDLRTQTSARAQSRTLERAMTLPYIPESQSPNQQGAEQATS